MLLAAGRQCLGLGGASGLAAAAAVAAQRLLLQPASPPSRWLASSSAAKTKRAGDRGAGGGVTSDDKQEAEVRAELTSMGVPWERAEKALSKAKLAGTSDAARAVDLLRWVTPLWKVMGVESRSKRGQLLGKVLGTPQLLTMLPDSLRAKAVAMQAPDGALCAVLSPQDVTQLIRHQPAVLQYDPDALATKLRTMAASLGTTPEFIGRRWAGFGLFSLSADTLDARLAALGDAIALPAPEVAKMVRRQPSLLKSSPDTLARRAGELSALLGLSLSDVAALVSKAPSALSSSIESMRERLGVLQRALRCNDSRVLTPALLAYATVLTRSADTMRLKFEIADAYGGLHPASGEQLKHIRDAQDARAIMCMAKAADERYALLECLLDMHGWRRQEEEAGTDESDGSDGSGSSGHVHGLPMMLTVLYCKSTRFEQLIAEHCPDFPAWKQATRRK